MKRKTELTVEHFGDLAPYIQKSDITDIDFNGTDVWLKDIYNNCWKADVKLSELFIEQFSNRAANIVSLPFNQGSPTLEAETLLTLNGDENDTVTLRISIGHEKVAKTGRTICIRKSKLQVRFTAQQAIEQNYCSRELLEFLVNCTIAGMRFVVCGEIGAGKTECGRFLSQYIPKCERVLTIEDNLEWHYMNVNPGANGVALKTDEELFTPYDAVKFALRQDADRIMLTEARGKEVKELINGWSTGTSGFATIHTDSVYSIPDRIFNMNPDQYDAQRLINDVYKYVDIGILVSIKQDDDGNKYRLIDQVCIFDQKDKKNDIRMLVNDGELISRELTERVKNKLVKKHIHDPWYCEVIEKQIGDEKADEKKE